MRIAVTGAAGRIGGRVVELLGAAREHQVMGIARRQLPAGPGCERLAVADYSDLDTLRRALTGVDTLVFVSSDGPVAKVVVHHHNVITAAGDAGVGHIVALSGLDADLDSPFCYATSYGYTEQLLRDSGCQLSIARASIYSEFFLGLLHETRADGEIHLPAADGRISLVSRADVASSLAALATTTPTSRHHDITGPESLDLTEIVTILGERSHTPIEYLDITPAEYQIQLARSGEDPWWSYAYSTMFDSIREQRWSSVSREVQQLTGTPPAPLRQVIADGSAGIAPAGP